MAEVSIVNNETMFELKLSSKEVGALFNILNEVNDVTKEYVLGSLVEELNSYSLDLDDGFVVEVKKGQITLKDGNEIEY